MQNLSIDDFIKSVLSGQEFFSPFNGFLSHQQRIQYHKLICNKDFERNLSVPL